MRLKTIGKILATVGFVGLALQLISTILGYVGLSHLDVLMWIFIFMLATSTGIIGVLVYVIGGRNVLPMSSTSESPVEKTMEVRIRCPKCGTLNSESQKFCGECGFSLYPQGTPPSSPGSQS
ncbi:zinc-ribbon domain-containing protein [Candidatus Bathyarchaeota archaeon]|nr:zinc-ribbon domain-containing protein [Candidatus Bathyarchaeota archaeon]